MILKTKRLAFFRNHEVFGKEIPQSRMTSSPQVKALKAGFHLQRSRSRNQKRIAYDLVKTAFRFRLRFRRLRSAYDLVKTRLSESKAEAKELNQSQCVGTCIMIAFIPPPLLPTPTIWFSLDHKRNLNNGLVRGVGRNGNVLILLTLIPSRLRLRFFIFTRS